MSETTDSVAQLRDLLQGQLSAVLATRLPDGQPYTSLVAFAASPDLRWLVFPTLRGTQKYENLQNEPRAAVLVDDRENREADLMRASAATLVGRVEELTGDSWSDWERLFLARHPRMHQFVHMPDCALLGLRVDRILLVRRFSNVLEIRPDQLSE